MLNSYIQYIPMRRPYGFLGLYIKYSNDIPMIRPYDIRIPWTWPMTSQKKNLDDLAGHLPAAWKTSSRRGRSHPLRASGCGGRGAHRICVPWKIGGFTGTFLTVLRCFEYGHEIFGEPIDTQLSDKPALESPWIFLVWDDWGMDQVPCFNDVDCSAGWPGRGWRWLQWLQWLQWPKWPKWLVAPKWVVSIFGQVVSWADIKRYPKTGSWDGGQPGREQSFSQDLLATKPAS